MSVYLARNVSVTSRLFKKLLLGAFLGVFIALLPGIRVTQAQTLKADYRFQNTRASSVGSSSLTDTGSNTFQADLVDGVTRTVLRFPFNNGVRLSAATGQIPANSYTIVMLFKVDSVSGFVRLVDFKNRTSDNGLYIDNGHLESCTSCTNFAANTYVQVAYTRTSGGTFAGYVNGVLQGQGPDVGNDLVIDGSNILNFFQDDLAAGNEASAGSVARIRLYDAPMTGAQVAALDREPAGPTTFSVTNTNDSGLGSLRQAIIDANSNAGSDTISFNIAGSGVKTIIPLSGLPAISSPAVIDGTTQPGFAGTPLIELNGASAGVGANGLSISAGNTTVRGLIINRFSAQGMLLLTNGGNTIENTFIGTNAQGTSALPNTGIGIWIFGSPNNHIGSIQAGGGFSNLISGNGSSGFEGLRIEGNGASGNIVQGNRIGTTASGLAQLGNNGSGIWINGVPNNVIGGTSPGAGNVISGSIGGNGIQISGAGATGNLVQGNLIGLNSTGNAAIPNFGDGVTIGSCANNTIGGTAAGAGNVISGNKNNGILIDAGATGNLLQGNFIGTNAAGASAIANLRNGISVSAAANNTIGGTANGARNIISGNSQDGIGISGNSASGNQIQGNYIGTNASGSARIGNGDAGILIVSAPNNTIGGTAAGSRNVISGSDSGNIFIFGNGANANLIQGNFIGTDATGTFGLPGIRFEGVGVSGGANNNVIGGTTAAARNIISGGQGYGVDILGATTGTIVQGNFIGTDVTGTLPVGNALAGVAFSGGNNATIGGTAPGADNRIAFNNGEGVNANGGTGNAILSNSIFANALLGIRLNSNSGANNNQAAPLLTSVQSFGGNTTIRGTLNSGANKVFTIQFFINDACDPSGAGEGQIFLGSITSTTDGNGAASFTAPFATGMSLTQVVTATATDPANNTSAFSLCRPVSTFNITGHVADVSGNNLGGITINLTGTVSNQAATDSSGNYSFTALPGGGNYTVTPSSSGLTFSPGSFTFNNLDTNRIANFVGTQTQVNINGTVVDGSDVAMNNVTVALTKNGAPAGTTQTNVLGNYSFGNLEAGANYVVTPTGSFTPSSQSLTNLTTNATANFKAAPSIPSQCNTASFAAASNFAANTNPISAGLGDFNGDGKLDLAVLDQFSSNVSILLGTGTGNFSAATNFAVGSGPRSVAVGDFNGDGKVDLAVANVNSNNVSILLGNGIGTFGAATNFTVGTGPRGVAIGDFNGDGKVDLATANANSNNVSILLGSGTGSFSAATNFPVGQAPQSFAIGDFNGDGKVDLAVANVSSNNVSILLGTGTGSFNPASNFAVGSNPRSVALGDFNDDGKLDLAAAADNVSILLGTGTGSFGAATNFAAGTGPNSVAVGDFNGDGKLDLAVANGNSHNVSILLGSGTSSFNAATNFAAGTVPVHVAVGDFNADGEPDLAVANNNSSNVSVLLNNGSVCNTQTSLSISGRIADSRNASLADVTVTLSGPITRVTQTDSNGNYLFANLVPGGNYSVTLQSSYFVFAPSRADFVNLGSSQVANFIAAPLAVPSPTPTPNDDFTSTIRDASKWTIGTQTSPAGSFDPQVTTAQVNGQLVITPLSQAAGMHYDGYVSANAFDMRNGSAQVELVKAATGGADTIFAVGSDTDNFYRFMVNTAGGPSSPVMMLRYEDGSERPLDTTVAQLIFQVNVNGQLTSLSIDYNPALHRFMRFRHVPPANSIVFETSPDNIDFTVQHTVVLQKSVSALTAELSAGTSNPTNPGQTVFDNFGLVTSTFQFSAGSYSVGEGDGSILVTVTRSGSLADAATVDFATTDGTARQKTKYTSAAGTLSFASGIASRTFRVLLIDNQLAEGDQTLNLLLSNPTGSGLNSPGRAILNIVDNDSTLATTNSLDDARYFVTQHYYDFLSRVPDQSGLDFWVSQITLCGTDQACLRTQRITVSNAFFYEQEYQQTGSYVVRVYRAAYGNNQPIPNNDANPQFPNENKKLVNYSAFSPDRARVRGGPSLAQTQLDLANAFVLRPQFIAKYPASLDEPAFVDAMLATINNDIGVNLSSQRTALIDLFNQGGRGKVLYRLADDNASNPIANQAFLDAEYNRSFVLTQYFGYLRRNPDVGGFVFWLGQVNSAPLRSLDKQRAMVCSFITSLEYQQRFSPVATHNNTECQ